MINSLYRRIRGKTRSWLRKWKTRPHPGLPAGLEFDELESVLVKIGAAKQLHKTAYIHISGWKQTGAYRLFLQTDAPERLTLIYKDAFYGTEQLPALQGLPYLPGLPEFSIYRNPPTGLLPFLPRIFLSEEVDPGCRYRYLFEDLRREYHVLRDPGELLGVIATLAEVHAALRESSQPVGSQPWLNYNPCLCEHLEAYAEPVFRRYAAEKETFAGEFLEKWEDVSRIHRSAAPSTLEMIQLVHGDLNITNVHVKPGAPVKMKLVDWEWAGWGLPHLDLACLLKRTEDAFEQQALGIFASNDPRLSLDDHWRLYRWCQLDRGILDASFLAAQVLDQGYHSSWNMAGFLEGTLGEILRRTRELS